MGKITLILLLFLIIPFAEVNAENKLIFTGMGQGSKYVLQAAYQKLGIDTEIMVMPGERAVNMANAGLVDGEAIRINDIDSKYPNLILIPVPVYQVDIIMFAANSLDIPVEGWESLNSYKIGIQRGMKIVENKTLSMNVTRLDSLEQAFKMLRSGRIDIGISSKVDVLIALKKMR